MEEKTILISDLSIAEPKSALSTRPEPGCWYMMEYELTDGAKGVMLTADPLMKADEITIPLNVTGVYRIFIGVNYFMQPYGVSSYGSLWIKLEDDAGFSRIGMEADGPAPEGLVYRQKIKPIKSTKEHYNTIYGVYWRTAEVHDTSIRVSLPQAPYARELANISFIRLEPASPEEIRISEDLRPRSETSNLAHIWCAGALTGHTSGQQMYHPENPQWFVDEFQACRDTDIGIFVMEAMRGNLCLFRTKIGDTGQWDRSWDERWADPLAEFTRLAHDNGVKIFAGMRMIGAGRPNAFYPINWGRFFWENTQWAKRTKEGGISPNLSIAYKEVRDHWLGLLEEALDYGVDGIHLHLNRCRPFVMYETPVVQSFIEEYGEDPRHLDTWDETWIRHTSSFVTLFLREISELVRGRGKEFSIIFLGFREFVPGSINSDAVDADTIAREGLADYFFLDHSVDPKYIRYWKTRGGGRLKVYYSLMPRQQPGEAYAGLAQSLYDAGADGFCIWDAERRVQRVSEWNVLKHLGHRDYLKHFEENAPDFYRFNTIKRMRGYDVEFAYFDG